MYLFSIDANKCERCFDCVTACPRGVFEEGELHPVVVHPEECIGCWVCLAVCRSQGLKVLQTPEPVAALWNDERTDWRVMPMTRSA